MLLALIFNGAIVLAVALYLEFKYRKLSKACSKTNHVVLSFNHALRESCIVQGKASSESKEQDKVFANEIARIYQLIDLLQVQSQNPIIQMIYAKLRTLPWDKLPKNETDYINFSREVAKDFHVDTWQALNKLLADTENEDARAEIKSKLKTLTDVINLIDSVDENSSMDYMKLIASEIFNTMADDRD